MHRSLNCSVSCRPWSLALCVGCLWLHLAAMTASPAVAAEVHWNVFAGDWNWAPNWYPSVVPNDAVFNSANINNAGTAVIDSPPNFVESVVVGDTFSGNLNISDEGRLQFSRFIVGKSNTSYTSAVRVTGADSELAQFPSFPAEFTEEFVIGDGGSGELTVEDGAIARTYLGLHVGRGSHGSGLIEVDGAGSQILVTLQQPLIVGGFGDGEIVITHGGEVYGNTTLANKSSGTGIVRVDGTGSLFNTDDPFDVGLRGMGTLEVTDGATADVNNSATLGGLSGSSGQTLVTGASSLIDVSSSLVVGDEGTGDLDVLSGGEVRTGDQLIIASQGGSTAHATVRGGGSRIQAQGRLSVGDLGNGTLEINNAGVVETAGNLTVAHRFMGAGARGTGEITVSGSGSLMDIGNLLRVGRQGDGTLNLMDGGTVQTGGDTFIGDQEFSTGDVNISDTGSLLDVGNDLFVGVQGDGSLEVTAGGTVKSRRLLVDNSAQVRVEGAGSRLETTSSLVVDNGAGGTLIVADGGVADSLSNFIVGTIFGGPGGDVTVENPGSRIEGRTVSIGTRSPGSLLVADGGTLLARGTLTLGSNSGGVADVTVDGTGSMIEARNFISFGVSGGSGTLNITGGGLVRTPKLESTNNASSLQFDDGTLQITRTDAASNRLVMNAGGGTVDLPDASHTFTLDTGITGEGGLTKTGAGTFQLNDIHSFAGPTAVAGGTLLVDGVLQDSDVTVQSSAVLGGTGQIQNEVTIDAGGTLAPGASTGTLTVGSVDQDADGLMEFEIAGTDPGEFDVLNVIGDAQIGGDLIVSLLGGFEPAVGDSFDLLDFSSLSGAFSEIDLPTLTEGQWDDSALLTDGVLSVVADLPDLDGDFNPDGNVDGADFLAWQRGESPDPLSPADLADWQGNYGTAASQSVSSTAVPEPASQVLLVIGGIALFSRKRRR